ncbi:MAG: hypothetical protein K9M54_11150 [Kiritimatiellales bacterium]|nr:hypothetical protein [Kiritimatiellales bacterium]
MADKNNSKNAPVVKKGSINESANNSKKSDSSHVNMAFTGSKPISKGGSGSGDKK